MKLVTTVIMILINKTVVASLSEYVLSILVVVLVSFILIVPAYVVGRWFPFLLGKKGLAKQKEA